MLRAHQHASHPETGTGENCERPRPWRVRNHIPVDASPQILLVSRGIYAGAGPIYKKACFGTVETTPEHICVMSKIVPGLQDGDVKEALIHFGSTKKYRSMGHCVSCTGAFLQTGFDHPYSDLCQVVLVVGTEFHDPHQRHKCQCGLFGVVTQCRRRPVLIHRGNRSHILQGVDVFAELRN